MEVVDICMLSNSHEGSVQKIMTTCLFLVFIFLARSDYQIVQL
jgi:hypothetical protein